MTPALEFQNLFVQFNRRKAEPLIAVAGLTLGMEPGQVYALLGPNGSGKTTTVNVACGLLRPASGTVRVHGIDVTADVAAVRAILGVVPQETALYNDLTAHENLAFHARLYRVPSAERERRIAEVLNLVGLTSRQHDRVGTYSGGMQRRLALARALLTRPAVVILDEPTLGVDVQSRAAIWDRIRQLARDGQTVLLTTNYMEEAQALADHLAILDHGRLIAQGTVPELRQQVGGSHIELEADMTPAQADGLRHLPGISSVSGRLPLLRMAAERGQALPVLMDYLRSEGIVPRSLTVREPDLNDVFLQLTGKGLRD